MRLQRTGLAALAQEVLRQEPFSAGAILAFVGKRYDRIKLLAWDRNGFDGLERYDVRVQRRLPLAANRCGTSATDTGRKRHST